MTIKLTEVLNGFGKVEVTHEEDEKLSELAAIVMGRLHLLPRSLPKKKRPGKRDRFEEIVYALFPDFPLASDNTGEFDAYVAEMEYDGFDIRRQTILRGNGKCIRFANTEKVVPEIRFFRKEDHWWMTLAMGQLYTALYQPGFADRFFSH